MLKLFKQGIMAQLVLILVGTVLLWSGSFVHPVEMMEPTGFGPLYRLLYHWLGALPRVATAIALLLVIGQGLMLNEMLYSRKMVSQNTLMPMFLYILIMSQNGIYHTLTPAILVNTMVMISMTQTLQAGQPNLSVASMSSAAACVSVASIVYLPAVTLLVPLLIMMPIFKMYRWNDWLGLILGLIGPYLLLMLIYYLNDSLMDQLELMKGMLLGLDFDLHGTTLQYVCAGVTLLFTVVTMIGGLQEVDGQVQAYKNNVAVLLLPMISGLAMIIYEQLIPLQMQWFAISVTFCAATFFWNAHKRLWAYELVLWSIIIVTILSIL